MKRKGFKPVKYSIPWQVLLIFEWFDGSPSECGGTLISNQWIGNVFFLNIFVN